MVIRLRNGRTIRSPPGIKMSGSPLPASCDPIAREDSPVPSLRSSSSSFEDLDVNNIDEDNAGSTFVGRGFKFILGMAFAAAAIYGKWHNFSKSPASTPDDDTAKLQQLYAMSLPTTQQELITLNNELATLDPAHKWAHFHLHDGTDAEERNVHPLVQATSFGPTGLVILDHLAKYNLLDTIPVITMDTLHLFHESYVFYETVQEWYRGSGLHLTVTKPTHRETHDKILSKEEFQHVYGAELWKDDHKMYTKVTKLDPMQQKLEEWGAIMWITGRRRSQGGERGNLNVLEFEPYIVNRESSADVVVASDENQYDHSKGRWKLNPLAYWSYDKVWSYIRENSVPYNTLYDKGYTSIGDEMTTSLPESKSGGEHGERSGRFTGFGVSNKECGLHVDLDLDLPGMEEVKDDDNDGIIASK